MPIVYIACALSWKQQRQQGHIYTYIWIYDLQVCSRGWVSYKSIWLFFFGMLTRDTLVGRHTRYAFNQAINQLLYCTLTNETNWMYYLLAYPHTKKEHIIVYRWLKSTHGLGDRAQRDRQIIYVMTLCMLVLRQTYFRSKAKKELCATMRIIRIIHHLSQGKIAKNNCQSMAENSQYTKLIRCVFSAFDI